MTTPNICKRYCQLLEADISKYIKRGAEAIGRLLIDEDFATQKDYTCLLRSLARAKTKYKELVDSGMGRRSTREAIQRKIDLLERYFGEIDT
jgi:hypothetical protein